MSALGLSYWLMCAGLNASAPAHLAWHLTGAEPPAVAPARVSRADQAGAASATTVGRRDGGLLTLAAAVGHGKHDHHGGDGLFAEADGGSWRAV